MTDHERELLMMLARSIHSLEQDRARQMNRDPMTGQSSKRREELIEPAAAETYVERLDAAARAPGQ